MNKQEEKQIEYDRIRHQLTLESLRSRDVHAPIAGKCNIGTAHSRLIRQGKRLERHSEANQSLISKMLRLYKQANKKERERLSE